MESRFRHILVPVDLSSKNIAAVELALEMAAGCGARTTLFHVVERIEPDNDDDADDEELRTFYEDLEKRAAHELQDVALRFSRAGLAVESHVWIGKRVAEIVRFAAEQKVDLVVLTSPQVDAERPAQSLASATFQVSVFCSCPVLMVKHTPDVSVPQASGGPNP
ncbi:MAG: universal stress protein [Planctomycetaceae bacterium]|nr:universal stress protein [Planctomycetaceae bacterium]